MTDQKPTIVLQPNNPLTISEVSEQTETGVQSVRNDLRSMIDRHYQHFGTKPLQIEHNPSVGGETLTPRSVIGQINGNNFVLRIDSKISGLSVGKCLGLAQKCGYNRFSKYRGEMERQELSDKEEYDTIDYFAISFLSVVSSLTKNGLDKTFSQETSEKSEFTGQLDIEKSIKRGKINNSPIVQTSVSDSNTHPNQLIKTALTVCKENVNSRDVSSWAASLYPHFESVDELSDSIDNNIRLDLSIPREDYELAVELAGIILNGSAADLGSQEGFLPFFTLNMNKLFEYYVQYAVKDILNMNKFSVDYNRNRDHHIEPELTSKNIKPDLVIRNDKNSIVLDMKNKYDCVENSDVFRVRNEDLYQISYYRQALNGKFVFLVYPGGKEQASQYAIKKSESSSAYKRRRDRRFNDLIEDQMYKIFPDRDSEIILFKWVIDLSGTIDNTNTNIAQLSQLIADLITDVHDKSNWS